MDEVWEEGEEEGAGEQAPGGRRDERRQPPPDGTGAEAAYLLQHKEARTPMLVRLDNGEEVRGVIEYYDRDMVKINRTDGPNLFIRKSHIRYMHRLG